MYQITVPPHFCTRKKFSDVVMTFSSLDGKQHFEVLSNGSVCIRKFIIEVE